MSHLFRILILLSIVCLNQALGQKKSVIQIGEKHTIRSSVLNEIRDYYLYVPENTKKPLPVILVFDGENLFDLTVTTARFMNSASELPQLPEAIIVGILNTDRNRDMPTPHSFDNKGEANFAEFISKELIPALGKQYSLNGHTILIGHSQGGLFSSYLLSKSPHDYPWVLAIDAPMSVDKKTAGISEKITDLLNDQTTNSRYVSIEAIYGWGSEWSKIKTSGTKGFRFQYPEETHESLPAQGLYTGLKTLFLDYAPSRKDFSLSQLKDHFSFLTQQYGFLYEIPYTVLTGSANRKQLGNRKTELLEIVDYCEKNFGPSVQLLNFRNAASTMTNESAAIVDGYLNLTKPTAEQIKPFLGTWIGEISRKQTLPEGVYLPFNARTLEIEIGIINGKSFLCLVNPPWAPGKKEEQEIFHVSKDGTLIYGYRNRGAGVIISKARINAKGQLEGSEKLEGSAIPPGIPEEDRKRAVFLNTNPATFELIKK